MRSLRSRFILSHILPVLVILPVLGLLLIYLLESQVLLADLSEDLAERAEFISQAISGQPQILVDPESAGSYIGSFNNSTAGEIILFGPSGTLLASSDAELRDMLGQIPDLEGLQQALGGEATVILRYSWIESGGTALVPVADVNEQLIGVVGVTEKLSGAASQIGNLRRLILYSLVTSLVFGIGIAIFLAQRLGRPILTTTEAVAEIAEGKRITPIVPEGPQEIQDLIMSVNTLSANLRSLEEIRRRLLANLVHEIGRPLGAIRAAIHTMRTGAAKSPETNEELLRGIEDEIIRMQPLLDDLAQLHGHVMRRIVITPRSVFLSDWLPALLVPWRAAALDKGLEWEATIPGNMPALELDPDKIGQVIGNLLSNAIKYTPEGGSVEFRAEYRDPVLVISIRDSGPGISEGEQQRIFEPFYRSEESRRFPQGLGLGLTIARDLIEAHGGRLELSSAPGKGSTFTLVVPSQRS